ncbi:uncharacterized protein LOC106177991 [Lingula anatina]|uniref:Uncharacterized protein LOC106177991 n=1 Tax=Lingula anatina TaxID=7574 RepID=A0A1S3K2C6_LINAN|nr:uncharacterized protein LOC106177991 [Lingula anatina]XP_013416417.1 uncharacterized protein LOC106177991 [Lingula anatina]XP_013416418.1 uncharacterized protein LOC106177991 [Lingula anatina]XP_013416419.1 uncharacterized protein LOC106177991 [Lingula anatina]XP_013416420.1 uncharacterized protein LOC106177991 [Lingula anatina]XP_013416421.1 uncharacterized protein LOC106177991 [Lingula anatina]|eukprot:XP_013416416.1 uncharacterized protein LOC106177991 [Lingula anatina]
MTSYPGELGVMYQKFVTPGPDNFHHIRKLDIRLRSNIPASPAYSYTSRSITDPQPSKSHRRRSKTAPHKLSATTRSSETEYIQDIVVPLNIDHHEAKNLERSVSSNSFGSRSQVKRVPLHHTSQETLQNGQTRLHSPRETKSLPIFGERYMRSGPGSTTSEDSLTLYGASPHQRKSWNSSPQAKRLEAEQRFVAKSRMLKRTSEAQVHSHRVDRMYYMQGRALHTKHKYDVDEAELQRLRELARVRSMHYNRALRGDHYTPHTGEQTTEAVQQSSSASDLPKMTVTGKHMVAVDQTFITQDSGHELQDGSSPPNRPNSPLTSRSGGMEDAAEEGAAHESGQEGLGGENGDQAICNEQGEKSDKSEFNGTTNESAHDVDQSEVTQEEALKIENDLTEKVDVEGENAAVKEENLQDVVQEVEPKEDSQNAGEKENEEEQDSLGLENGELQQNETDNLISEELSVKNTDSEPGNKSSGEVVEANEPQSGNEESPNSEKSNKEEPGTESEARSQVEEPEDNNLNAQSQETEPDVAVTESVREKEELVSSDD